ncbi:helix-turn-helix domain-containing protein [Thermoanaerobacter sp. A7A]|uniref:helix-turn-helix domain-containing protein n=1 Tax=Thermoanaerobacter sp. A7A TaxID=1350366 RepID=UPI00235B6D71|nr:helix-turn-helix domain-containing protein [Thermoanaerobacter sp. A7A]
MALNLRSCCGATFTSMRAVTISQFVFSQFISENILGLFFVFKLFYCISYFFFSKPIEEEEYLKKCAEAIRDMPVDKGKKGNIATSAQILAWIVYDKEIIERIFSEVIGMSILEESKIYREILDKGKKEGEREKSIEIAKELLKEGMDINKIAQITKLSVEEIKKLLN